MKQNITRQQWDELTIPQKITWFDTIYFGKEYTYKTFTEYALRYEREYSWTVEDQVKQEEDHFYDSSMHLPTIGEMIEFLSYPNTSMHMTIFHEGKNVHWKVKDDIKDLVYESPSDELCDALFSAVKRTLELNNSK